MRPPRAVFATDYILETVQAYGLLSGLAPEDLQADLQWSSHVLERYFSTVPTAAHPAVAQAERAFVALPVGADEVSQTPFVRPPRAEQAASLEALHALAAHRRSCRWFTDRPVDRQQLEAALALGATAPSACNRQSIRFLVYDQPERVQEILSVPMGTAGFAHQVPVCVVVVGQQRGYPAERDRHVVYVDASLAVMSVLLAAEAQGLGTCCINWAALPDREEDLRRRIGLADDEVIVLLLAVGHPDPAAEVPFSAKRALSQLVEYNRP